MTTFTRTWDETDPADADKAKFGAQEIRELKSDIQERMDVDHMWDGDTQDGEHKQLTMPEQAADPSNVADKGFVYTKDVDGITELFYEDSDGNVTQLTSGGLGGLYSGSDVRVSASGTHTLTGNSWIPIICDTEASDTATQHDTTTGVITIAAAGWYDFYVRGTVSSPDTNPTFTRFKYTPNGGSTVYYGGDTGTNAVAPNPTYPSGIFGGYFTAGDTVAVEMQHINTTKTLAAGVTLQMRRKG